MAKQRRATRIPKMPTVKPIYPTEAQEQTALVSWLRNKGIKHSGSSNGAHVDIIEAVKLKRMGLSKGFPDIEIPIPFKGKFGLYIEMKRKSGGILSPEQKDWLEYLNSVGYVAEVANGFEHAVKIVENYFKQD